jgi:hypothetical protein
VESIALEVPDEPSIRVPHALKDLIHQQASTDIGRKLQQRYELRKPSVRRCDIGEEIDRDIPRVSPVAGTSIIIATTPAPAP